MGRNVLLADAKGKTGTAISWSKADTNKMAFWSQRRVCQRALKEIAYTILDVVAGSPGCAADETHVPTMLLKLYRDPRIVSHRFGDIVENHLRQERIIARA